MNLIAKRPAVSLEKNFSATFGLEASYVWGVTDYLPFTDHYKYNGFLLRAKKYTRPIENKEVNFYYGLYAGSLKRTVQSQGYVHPTGFLSIASRNFSANSIRTGVSSGLSYNLSSRIILDASSSIGYGKYFSIKNDAMHIPSKGYLDIQVWFSAGYTF